MYNKHEDNPFQKFYDLQRALEEGFKGITVEKMIEAMCPKSKERMIPDKDDK
jgi:hypothetical protein